MIGHMMADPVSLEAEPIDRNTYKAETSFITAITTNNMIKQIKENQHKKESFHIEENDTEKKQQKIILDENLIQDIYENESLLNENQGETISESISKSSVCSICKSRRPNNEWQRKCITPYLIGNGQENHCTLAHKQSSIDFYLYIILTA